LLQIYARFAVLHPLQPFAKRKRLSLFKKSVDYFSLCHTNFALLRRVLQPCSKRLGEQFFVNLDYAAGHVGGSLLTSGRPFLPDWQKPAALSAFRQLTSTIASSSTIK
jgi:hypothetical protein